MKKYLFISIVLTLFSFKGYNQQITQYSTYMWNQFAFNPALAGIKTCTDIRSAYRFQWVGFEGAPRSGYMNVSYPIKTSNNNLFAPTHGVGVNVERDDIGPFGFTNLWGAYAIHLNLNRTTVLSAGFQFGFKQFSFDVNNATTIYPDPSIQNSVNSFIFPDGGFGLWLNSENYYVGFSAIQLFKNKWKNIGYNSVFTAHFNLTAGYKMNINEEFTFIPSAMMRMSGGVPPSFDLTMLFGYKNLMSAGISYRNVDAVVALFKINFLKYFFVGYAYDINTSRLRSYNSGTHEISIGVYTCKQADRSLDTCPVFE